MARRPSLASIARDRLMTRGVVAPPSRVRRCRILTSGGTTLTTIIDNDRLPPVLEVAEANAASVDRDARFPHGDRRGARGIRACWPDAARRPSAAWAAAPSDSADRAAARLACASSAMIYLMHECAAQVTLAGTHGRGSDILRGMAAAELWARSRSASEDRAATSGRPSSQIAGGSITAQKSLVTSAGHAKTYVVSTRPEGTE